MCARARDKLQHEPEKNVVHVQRSLGWSERGELPHGLPALVTYLPRDAYRGWATSPGAI